MPNLYKINDEIRAGSDSCRAVRQKYLRRLHDISTRNIILYYSGWLHKSAELGNTAIDELDKNEFMGMISGWKEQQRNKGLDLILHTPGGDMSATESLGNYLLKMFNHNVRVIVPQLAMSGGTMLACMGKSIVMGKHSSLGPTDPQFGGFSASQAVIEFEQAAKEYSNKPHWRPILEQYSPGFYTECKHSIEWSKEVVSDWLAKGMFAGDANKIKKAKLIAERLSDSSQTYAHSRQIDADACKKAGLRIDMLEDNQDMQDAVLSLHHACMWAFANTKTLKIIENHKGASSVRRHD